MTAVHTVLARAGKPQSESVFTHDPVPGVQHRPRLSGTTRSGQRVGPAVSLRIAAIQAEPLVSTNALVGIGRQHGAGAFTRPAAGGHPPGGRACRGSPSSTSLF